MANPMSVCLTFEAVKYKIIKQSHDQATRLLVQGDAPRPLRCIQQPIGSRCPTGTSADISGTWANLG